MTELLLLDLVLMVGVAVLPRHVKRSFLAIRRMAKEGLRDATAREPVTALAAARTSLGRAGRTAREELSFETMRPALLPVAAALVAATLVAGYARWASPGPAEVAVQAAVEVAPGAAEAEAHVSCDEEAERHEARMLLKRALEIRGDVTGELRRSTRRAAAEAAVEALEALPEAAMLRSIRIL